MKIAILGDCHFGMRGDALAFMDFAEKFYSQTFFPYLIENNIDTIIQVGDFFDRRKYINFLTLSRTREMFLDKLVEYNMRMIVLAGNHDTYHKNTNQINSPDLLFKEYKNVTVVDRPMTIPYITHEPDSDMCFIPWICTDNYEQCLKEVESTTAKICFGHFEFAGFQMHRGHVNEEGIDPKPFGKFDRIFSGHYHHRSHSGNIYYVGTPMEITWNDYNDQKGFNIFDTDTYELKFVPNPNTMFYRILYDDKKETITEVMERDVSIYKNTYVKVVVVNKTNPYLFDRFMNSLYDVNPIDITIVEDFADLTEGIEDDTIDETEDTVTIINRFVDSITEANIENDRLKTLMRELYVEALNESHL